MHYRTQITLLPFTKAKDTKGTPKRTAEISEHLVTSPTSLVHARIIFVTACRYWIRVSREINKQPRPRTG